MNHANAVSLFHTRQEVLDAIERVDELMEQPTGQSIYDRFLLFRKTKLVEQLAEIDREMAEVMA